MKIKIPQLHNNIRDILILNGIDLEDATIAAEVLVEGDKRGYYNHGSDRIFQILEGINKQTLYSNNSPEIFVNNEAITLIDAKHSLGYKIAKEAMDIAIEKSKKIGIGVSGVINSSHIGVLSYYSELAASKESIGLVMSVSSPAAILNGGSKKLLGTNPMCYSIPYSNSSYITADFATTKVSRGKIYEYAKKNLNIPYDWAVDHEGNPTNDPYKALKGGLCLFDNGYKSFMISLLISILGGPLIGGLVNHKVNGTRETDNPPNKGDLFIAFNIASFTDLNSFYIKVKSFLNEIKKDKSEMRIPGKRSYKKIAKAKKEGVKVSKELIHLFNEYCTGNSL